MEGDPRLSLTLGVRWEYESFPGPQLANAAVPQTSNLNDMKTILVRASALPMIYGSGKTILRGGYGMFFARAINSTLYQALIGTGAAGSQTNPNSIAGQTCAPVFPQIVAPAQHGACLGSASGNATVLLPRPQLQGSPDPSGRSHRRNAGDQPRCLQPFVARIVGTPSA